MGAAVGLAVGVTGAAGVAIEMAVGDDADPGTGVADCRGVGVTDRGWGGMSASITSISPTMPMIKKTPGMSLERSDMSSRRSRPRGRRERMPRKNY